MTNKKMYLVRFKTNSKNHEQYMVERSGNVRRRISAENVVDGPVEYRCEHELDMGTINKLQRKTTTLGARLKQLRGDQAGCLQGDEARLNIIELAESLYEIPDQQLRSRIASLVSQIAYHVGEYLIGSGGEDLYENVGLDIMSALENYLDDPEELSFDREMFQHPKKQP